ncbi:chitotriosidase-1 [Cephus cinctus]|uniref:chitinase n=1 Tax=Cephus cinctus TaxID=211228 RepID=A0AAJ7BTQ7_CEPCN|nr:chitotriosidase-1 [Cephus cinctus]
MNLFVIVCIMTTLLGPALGRVMLCYFGSRPRHYGKDEFQVSDVIPQLCTHYIYSFIGVTREGDIYIRNQRNNLSKNHKNDDFEQFVALKKTKPAPKLLIAIGEWNAGSKNFSHVVNNVTIRARFVRHAIAFLEEHTLDGVDFDWAYDWNAIPNPPDVPESDRRNLVELAKVLKAGFVKKGYLLTAAVAGPKYIASRIYNIPALAKILDYINVMTFDLITPFNSVAVGHHAALAPAKYQANNATLLQANVRACIGFWLNSGAPASKLVLGLPLYGITFTLADTSKTSPGSPSAGPGRPGPYTRQPGLMGYNEFCKQQKTRNYTTVWSTEQVVSFSYSDDQWIGHDDQRSFTEKIRYARKHKLAGIMLRNIENDDFRGTCRHGRYPLLKTAKAALNADTLEDAQDDVTEDVKRD